ncbi:exonuclease/endonuclease/phosphatase family protein [Nocardioides acrostichi]|uniref:Endonuclease/exonuclease/phosphatase domain-containing protein n=1 Tax=Nocardioides acrostichi TaxID=2784339 RepID=A0A930UXE7_9ACTN|nr:hypothetical protein [Nocardioides acrostichi]MBF4161891.1 hypothetical protein [Nocardioides acrostichi]
MLPPAPAPAPAGSPRRNSRRISRRTPRRAGALALLATFTTAAATALALSPVATIAEAAAVPTGCPAVAGSAASTSSSAPSATTSSTSEATPTGDSSPTPMIDPSHVQMVQANIKSGMALGDVKADLRKVYRSCPDFVSFNEVPYRQDSLLAPQGYSLWRTPGQYRGETPVAWRTDRWTAIARGTTMVSNKQGYGAGQHVMWGVRYANWVTLRSTVADQTVSVISMHVAPSSPRTDGLVKPSVTRLGMLARDLSADGPVLMGGDLNRHYPSKTYPRETLTKYGLSAIYDLAGRYVPTGDHYGATVDYVFVKPADAFHVDKMSTRELNSDHDALVADLTIPTQTTRTNTSFSTSVMLSDNTSPNNQARTSVLRRFRLAVRKAHEDSQIRLVTTDFRMRRLAKDLMRADRRGVQIRLLSGSQTPTALEQRLADAFAASGHGSWVHLGDVTSQAGTPLTTMTTGATASSRRVTMHVDRAMGPEIVNDRTLLRTSIRKVDVRAAKEAFGQYRSQERAVVG